MEAKQKAKLERYFKNSSRFLWGLTPGRNQKETYQWLKSEGFVFENGSYGYVTAQLLVNPGIEAILRDLIIPRVKRLFTGKAIEFLNTCWLAGTRPDMSLLSLYNIKDASPFLEVNTQFNYVERWGEFAGLWFEEIEELQGSIEPTPLKKEEMEKAQYLEQKRQEATLTHDGVCRICQKQVPTLLSGVCEICFDKWALEARRKKSKE